jgi:pyridoxine/pyridoxamine 5'-phosphate oxidase
MTARALLDFLRSHRLAVEASVSPTGGAQAAVVGFAITDQFEIVFDTLVSTRKAQNLRQNPKIALVVGGSAAGEERTAQYEGIADEPSGAELEQLKRVYYTA